MKFSIRNLYQNWWTPLHKDIWQKWSCDSFQFLSWLWVELSGQVDSHVELPSREESAIATHWLGPWESLDALVKETISCPAGSWTNVPPLSRTKFVNTSTQLSRFLITIWRCVYRASYCNVLMTNGMHNSYNIFYSTVFCSTCFDELLVHHQEHCMIYCITQ